MVAAGIRVGPTGSIILQNNLVPVYPGGGTFFPFSAAGTFFPFSAELLLPPARHRRRRRDHRRLLDHDQTATCTGTCDPIAKRGCTGMYVCTGMMMCMCMCTGMCMVMCMCMMIMWVFENWKLLF